MNSWTFLNSLNFFFDIMKNYSCPHWVKSNYAPSVSNHADMLYWCELSHVPNGNWKRMRKSTRRELKATKKLIWLTVCQNKRWVIYESKSCKWYLNNFNSRHGTSGEQTFEKNSVIVFFLFTRKKTIVNFFWFLFLTHWDSLLEANSYVNPAEVA